MRRSGTGSSKKSPDQGAASGLLWRAQAPEIMVSRRGSGGPLTPPNPLGRGVYRGAGVPDFLRRPTPRRRDRPVCCGFTPLGILFEKRTCRPPNEGAYTPSLARHSRPVLPPAANRLPFGQDPGMNRESSTARPTAAPKVHARTGYPQACPARALSVQSATDVEISSFPALTEPARSPTPALQVGFGARSSTGGRSRSPASLVRQSASRCQTLRRTESSSST